MFTTSNIKYYINFAKPSQFINSTFTVTKRVTSFCGNLIYFLCSCNVYIITLCRRDGDLPDSFPLSTVLTGDALYTC